MANERLIEVISPQSYEAVQKLTAELVAALNVTTAWVGQLKNVKLPSQVKQSYEETSSAINGAKRVVSDYEKQIASLERAETKRGQATSNINKQTILLREETNKLNRETRLQAKYMSALSDVYTKIDAKLSILANEYRNLAVRKEIGVKLTDKEAARMDFLIGKISKYDAVLKKVDGQMGRNQRNVGNYKSAYDGLGFSIAQLTREAPAFANSMQTGFMAISNNIPMLTDEINKLRKANVELAASGQPTVSIFKKLAGAIFSWQTLISVGVTLLTLYGSKLFDMAFGMNETEKATKKANEAIKEQNDALRENIRLRKQQLSNVTDFINASQLQDNFSAILSGGIGDTEEKAIALLELAERLEAAGVKNADALKDQNILQSDRARIGLNLLEIEKQKVMLAEERLRLDDVLVEKRKIMERFDKGEISAKQKNQLILSLGNDTLGETLDIQSRIVQLEGENNILIGKGVDLKGEGNKEAEKQIEHLKYTVAYYQTLISKAVQLRDTTARTREEYEEFNKQILILTHSMGLLSGEWQKFVNSTKEYAKDGIFGDIKANTDALERQSQALIRQAAEREKAKQDALFAQKQIEDAFVRLGATLGIQELTVRNLFDGIVGGFDDAGDAAQAFGALATDALNALTAAQRVQMQERIDQLEKQKDIELAFAGESTEARAAIEERYQRQVAQEKRKQAQREKTAAIISSIINTATAVTKTFAQLGWPAGIPAAAVIGTLGLSQTAIIASQPIPAFKDGVRGFEGGHAIVGDGGKREPITDEKGRLIGVSPNRPTLVNLPPGSNVFKDHTAFEKELNAILGGNDISPLGNAVNAPIMVFNSMKSNGMTASEMKRIMADTLGSMAKSTTIIDKDGIKTFAQKEYSKGVSLNNRVTRKGISV